MFSNDVRLSNVDIKPLSSGIKATQVPSLASEALRVNDNRETHSAPGSKNPQTTQVSHILSNGPNLSLLSTKSIDFYGTLAKII